MSMKQKLEKYIPDNDIIASFGIAIVLIVTAIYFDFLILLIPLPLGMVTMWVEIGMVFSFSYAFARIGVPKVYPLLFLVLAVPIVWGEILINAYVRGLPVSAFFWAFDVFALFIIGVVIFSFIGTILGVLVNKKIKEKKKRE